MSLNKLDNNLILNESQQGRLIEELLGLSSAMVEALRGGANERAAKAICTMLLPYTNADAISVTDKTCVLAYVGYLEELFPADCQIRTKTTYDVLRDGRARTRLTEEEIGFPESHRRINAAILEPLVVMGDTVGVLKFYFKRASQVSKTEEMIAKGFARLISTQLAAHEAEHQRELNAIMELKMLQSQINPHFLFNTINTISSLTRTDSEKARHTLRDFAAFYRSTLEMDSESIELGEEINNTMRYVGLEQARFGDDKLKFECEIEEEGFRHFLVPPFILQPIVENSIRHGMPATGKLDISVKVFADNKFMHIEVKDNGKGMSEEKVKNLFIQQKKNGEGLGLALNNVHDRIRGYFGKRASIMAESNLDKGTTISFRLPLSK